MLADIAKRHERKYGWQVKAQAERRSLCDID